MRSPPAGEHNPYPVGGYITDNQQITINHPTLPRVGDFRQFAVNHRLIFQHISSSTVLTNSGFFRVTLPPSPIVNSPGYQAQGKQLFATAMQGRFNLERLFF